MKLENPGYRLNQRLYNCTISGSFEWKIRLQLSQAFCYGTGIPSFFSIVMEIIRESGALKIKDTIRSVDRQIGFSRGGRIQYIVLGLTFRFICESPV